MIKNYIFVASPSRIGHKTLKGPITGKKYIITPQGTWIDADDINLLEMDIPYYCFRSRKFLTTRIYETSPSANQMKEMPKG